jgi:hypothetical protein
MSPPSRRYLLSLKLSDFFVHLPTEFGQIRFRARVGRGSSEPVTSFRGLTQLFEPFGWGHGVESFKSRYCKETLM